MAFAPEVDRALRAAVALVNSSIPDEAMNSVTALSLFYSSFDYTGGLRRSEAELGAVRAIRPTLRDLLNGPESEAVEIINRVLREGRAIPQLVRHDAFAWHIHATQPEQPLAVRILVDSAMAMIDVIRAGEMDRFAVCEVQDCERLLVDLTRNRSRRFCSGPCAARVASAAYRLRRKDDELTESPVAR